MGLLRGVTGFVYHTVPIAIHAWLSNPHDYRSGVTAVIECGGDTDTTAAITGGIIGAAVGAGNIPQEWQNAICEWPRSVSWMTQLATQLSEPASQAHPVESAFPAMLLRNMVFIAVVLTHGFRRLAPPY
jgi:hypothetical protein